MQNNEQPAIENQRDINMQIDLLADDNESSDPKLYSSSPRARPQISLLQTPVISQNISPLSNELAQEARNGQEIQQQEMGVEATFSQELLGTPELLCNESVQSPDFGQFYGQFASPPRDGDFRDKFACTGDNLIESNMNLIQAQEFSGSDPFNQTEKARPSSLAQEQQNEDVINDEIQNIKNVKYTKLQQKLQVLNEKKKLVSESQSNSLEPSEHLTNDKRRISSLLTSEGNPGNVNEEIEDPFRKANTSSYRFAEHQPLEGEVAFVMQREQRQRESRSTSRAEDPPAASDLDRDEEVDYEQMGHTGEEGEEEMQQNNQDNLRYEFYTITEEDASVAAQSTSSKMLTSQHNGATRGSGLNTKITDFYRQSSNNSNNSCNYDNLLLNNKLYEEIVQQESQYANPYQLHHRMTLSDKNQNLLNLPEAMPLNFKRRQSQQSAQGKDSGGNLSSMRYNQSVQSATIPSNNSNQQTFPFQPFQTKSSSGGTAGMPSKRFDSSPLPEGFTDSEPNIFQKRQQSDSADYLKHDESLVYSQDTSQHLIDARQANAAKNRISGNSAPFNPAKYGGLHQEQQNEHKLNSIPNPAKASIESDDMLRFSMGQRSSHNLNNEDKTLLAELGQYTKEKSNEHKFGSLLDYNQLVEEDDNINARSFNSSQYYELLRDPSQFTINKNDRIYNLSHNKSVQNPSNRHISSVKLSKKHRGSLIKMSANKQFPFNNQNQQALQSSNTDGKSEEDLISNLSKISQMIPNFDQFEAAESLKGSLRSKHNPQLGAQQSKFASLNQQQQLHQQIQMMQQQMMNMQNQLNEKESEVRFLKSCQPLGNSEYPRKHNFELGREELMPRNQSSYDSPIVIHSGLQQSQIKYMQDDVIYEETNELDITQTKSEAHQNKQAPPTLNSSLNQQVNQSKLEEEQEILEIKKELSRSKLAGSPGLRHHTDDRSQQKSNANLEEILQKSSRNTTPRQRAGDPKKNSFQGNLTQSFDNNEPQTVEQSPNPKTPEDKMIIIKDTGQTQSIDLPNPSAAKQLFGRKHSHDVQQLVVKQKALSGQFAQEQLGQQTQGIFVKQLFDLESSIGKRSKINSSQRHQYISSGDFDEELVFKEDEIELKNSQMAQFENTQPQSHTQLQPKQVVFMSQGGSKSKTQFLQNTESETQNEDFRKLIFQDSDANQKSELIIDKIASSEQTLHDLKNQIPSGHNYKSSQNSEINSVKVNHQQQSLKLNTRPARYTVASPSPMKIKKEQKPFHSLTAIPRTIGSEASQIKNITDQIKNKTGQQTFKYDDQSDLNNLRVNKMQLTVPEEQSQQAQKQQPKRSTSAKAKGRKNSGSLKNNYRDKITGPRQERLQKSDSSSKKKLSNNAYSDDQETELVKGVQAFNQNLNHSRVLSQSNRSNASQDVASQITLAGMNPHEKLTFYKNRYQQISRLLQMQQDENMTLMEKIEHFGNKEQAKDHLIEQKDKEVEGKNLEMEELRCQISSQENVLDAKFAQMEELQSINNQLEKQVKLKAQSNIRNKETQINTRDFSKDVGCQIKNSERQAKDQDYQKLVLNQLLAMQMGQTQLYPGGPQMNFPTGMPIPVPAPSTYPPPGTIPQPPGFYPPQQNLYQQPQYSRTPFTHSQPIQLPSQNKNRNRSEINNDFNEMSHKIDQLINDDYDVLKQIIINDKDANKHKQFFDQFENKYFNHPSQPSNIGNLSTYANKSKDRSNTPSDHSYVDSDEIKNSPKNFHKLYKKIKNYEKMAHDLEEELTYDRDYIDQFNRQKVKVEGVKKQQDEQLINQLVANQNSLLNQMYHANLIHQKQFLQTELASIQNSPNKHIDHLKGNLEEKDQQISKLTEQNERLQRLKRKYGQGWGGGDITAKSQRQIPTAIHASISGRKSKSRSQSRSPRVRAKKGKSKKIAATLTVEAEGVPGAETNTNQGLSQVSEFASQGLPASKQDEEYYQLIQNFVEEIIQKQISKMTQSSLQQNSQNINPNYQQQLDVDPYNQGIINIQNIAPQSEYKANNYKNSLCQNLETINQAVSSELTNQGPSLAQPSTQAANLTASPEMALANDTEQTPRAISENVPYQHQAYARTRNEHGQFSVPQLFPSGELHTRNDNSPAKSHISVIDYQDENLINQCIQLVYDNLPQEILSIENIDAVVSQLVANTLQNLNQRSQNQRNGSVRDQDVSIFYIPQEDNNQIQQQNESQLRTLGTTGEKETSIYTSQPKNRASHSRSGSRSLQRKHSKHNQIGKSTSKSSYKTQKAKQSGSQNTREQRSSQSKTKRPNNSKNRLKDPSWISHQFINRLIGEAKPGSQPQSIFGPVQSKGPDLKTKQSTRNKNTDIWEAYQQQLQNYNSIKTPNFYAQEMELLEEIEQREKRLMKHGLKKSASRSTISNVDENDQTLRNDEENKQAWFIPYKENDQSNKVTWKIGTVEFENEKRTTKRKHNFRI